MDDRCHEEVVQLHRFFQDWFNGTLDKTDENFRRFGEVVAEEFQIILPNGEMTDREDILVRVRDAHGGNAASGTPIRIWIDAFRSRPIDAGLQLVTYQEWQQTDADPRGRRSTAVMRARPGTPNGVEWLHVHEVWLPAPQESG